MVEEENAHVEKIDKKSSLKSNLIFIIVLLAILIPIRFYVFQPFVVIGSSMEPTFYSKDYLIVDELSYHLGGAKRGQVSIFKFPGQEGVVADIEEAKSNPKYFIKRIIGLPGETVQITAGKVVIKNKDNPTGFSLDEPYVAFPRETNLTRTLTNDEYFVMGDNRDKSYDSRAWGPLKKENLVGRALIRLYPLKEIGILPGNYSESK